MNTGALFRVDALSLFIAAFLGFFTLLTLLYSSGIPMEAPRRRGYNVYLSLTFAAGLGAVFANHLVILLVFWGFLAFLLYILVGFGDRVRTPATAAKALIIIGGTDALMILGIGLVGKLAGTLSMDQIHLPTATWAEALAYLCLAAGALAKAGAMPFHSWVPDVAEDAPIPVTAFLPASVDKLLGIYFLVRLSLQMFSLSPALNGVLMGVGSLTLVAGVMMALVQHDLKRLLGYHAVSQVGYMMMGIGTGIPVGVAGGLFHMLNNALYKSCLFLGAGSVEQKTGTSSLSELGGLSRLMPITFVTSLVAAMAIAGVPPLNGFASKWMIYQGIIETGRGGSPLWIVWLTAAMFGSALTLASFMKIIHAVFLGQPAAAWHGRLPFKLDPSPRMWVPCVVLALLCVLFGVFAFQVPLRWLINPSLHETVQYPGFWNPGLATGLLLAGLAAGFLIYLLGRRAGVRVTDPFVGGESVAEHPEMRVSGTEFYKTIQDLGPLKSLYAWAEERRFDPYEAGGRAVRHVHQFFQYLHNGILPTYLAWCLLGAAVLLAMLAR